MIDLWVCGENELAYNSEAPNRSFARSLLWLGATLQGKWVQDYQLTEQFLREMFPQNEIAAAGLRDTAVTAIFFAALNSNSTNLYLEQAPTSFRYSPKHVAPPSPYSPKRAYPYTHSLLIPDILDCVDIPELLEMAGGKIHSIDPID